MLRDIGNAYEIGPKICKALDLPADRVMRLIIDLDAQEPRVKVYAQLLGEKGHLDALLAIIKEADGE